MGSGTAGHQRRSEAPWVREQGLCCAEETKSSGRAAQRRRTEASGEESEPVWRWGYDQEWGTESREKRWVKKGQ